MIKRLVLLLLLCASGSLLADEAEDWRKMRRIVPRGYICHPAVSVIEVDGRLFDANPFLPGTWDVDRFHNTP